jgi:hypothetical protein
VLTPIEAKGLEFDDVAVWEPAAIADGSIDGLRRLFVALTRPTHRLLLLTTTGLPPELDPVATCRCGLALQALWRHCPVCGAPYGAAGAMPASYRMAADGIRCRMHRKTGCPDCTPPDGYRVDDGGWRPDR